MQDGIYFAINHRKSQISQKLIDTISAKYEEYYKKVIVKLKNIEERKSIENSTKSNLNK